MSQEKRTREIVILVVVFGLLPLAFLFFLVLPVRKAIARHQARQSELIEEMQALPNVQNLTQEERKLVDDPAASWKTRIPRVASDAERLAHYSKVITDLQQACQAKGVNLVAVRSTWDPLQGSFTLPGSLGSTREAFPSISDSGHGRLQGWVLEAKVAGPTGQLFTALEVLPAVNPLLEPVGFRWEVDPAGGHQQMLVLRNMVLIP